jgi:hypothetical protein
MKISNKKSISTSKRTGRKSKIPQAKNLRRIKFFSILFVAGIAGYVGLKMTGSSLAAEVKYREDTAYVFQDTGIKAKYKIAIEKDSAGRVRAHLAGWCTTNGGIIGGYCKIDHNNGGSCRLVVQYWMETAKLWANTSTNTQPCGGTYNYPAGKVNSYTRWACTGAGTDQFRAVAYNVRYVEASGQSFTDTFVTPTWLGKSC